MSKSLFVADIGNSTIDVGEFRPDSPHAADKALCSPIRVAKVDIHDREAWNQITMPPDAEWLIGTVNKPIAEQFEQHLLSRDAKSIRFVDRRQFQLSHTIQNFESVGIDRLAGAAAANHLRTPDCPAIIVDAGTAITVDCVSRKGVFLGGMIIPGLRLCKESLERNTDQLPYVQSESSTPPLIGNETNGAIRSGVYWLIACGLDGILTRLQHELAGSCEVFGTGGSMPGILPHLDRHKVHHEPNLVLSGIANTWCQTQ